MLGRYQRIGGRRLESSPGLTSEHCVISGMLSCIHCKPLITTPPLTPGFSIVTCKLSAAHSLPAFPALKRPLEVAAAYRGPSTTPPPHPSSPFSVGPHISATRVPRIHLGPFRPSVLIKVNTGHWSHAQSDTEPEGGQPGSRCKC